ncbi:MULTISPECIES: hypothetical protein [unclassified Enterobacter]|uniref:hypothetical protein n=1 Tax=unclassified Enterobacter TaxID=2608935 RepID=UPI0011CDDB06|nr:MULTISPECIES: hypothetical protein [unclassified Enterobacter]
MGWRFSKRLTNDVNDVVDAYRSNIDNLRRVILRVQYNENVSVYSVFLNDTVSDYYLYPARPDRQYVGGGTQRRNARQGNTQNALTSGTRCYARRSILVSPRQHQKDVKMSPRSAWIVVFLVSALFWVGLWLVVG